MKKSKPTKKPHTKNMTRKNYNTRSKNSEKLQSCTIRHVLKSCNCAFQFPGRTKNAGNGNFATRVLSQVS